MSYKIRSLWKRFRHAWQNATKSVAPHITVDGVDYCIGDVRLMRDAAFLLEAATEGETELINAYWREVYGWDPMPGDEGEVQALRLLVRTARATETRS